MFIWNFDFWLNRFKFIIHWFLWDRFPDIQDQSQQISEPKPTLETCSICLLEIKEDFYQTSCVHCFHWKCLSRWLKQDSLTQSCPICRQNLSHIIFKHHSRKYQWHHNTTLNRPWDSRSRINLRNYQPAPSISRFNYINRIQRIDRIHRIHRIDRRQIRNLFDLRG